MTQKCLDCDSDVECRDCVHRPRTVYLWLRRVLDAVPQDIPPGPGWIPVEVYRDDRMTVVICDLAEQETP